MKTHVLASILEVPLAIHDVFEFFSDAANLESITPPELRFSIAKVQPVLIREGTIIDYRLGLYGLRFGWRSLISHWEPPHRFVDEQVKGPYARWHHEHIFEETEDGTRIRDTVEYSLPLYPAGEIALPLVRAQLRRIFTFRQKSVMRALGANEQACRWDVRV